MPQRLALAFAALGLFLSSPASADCKDAPVADKSPAPAPPAAPAAEGPPPKEFLVEFSFGNSYLFLKSDVVPNVDRSFIVPTSSALLLGELLLTERFAPVVLFNLPLAAQQTVVDGKVVEEKVGGALAAGARFTALAFDIRKQAHLELHLAAFGGVTLGGVNPTTPFPMLAARFHLGRPDGFAFYAGGSWAFRKETAALFYGLGHRF